MTSISQIPEEKICVSLMLRILRVIRESDANLIEAQRALEVAQAFLPELESGAGARRRPGRADRTRRCS